jgi:hypothetical protein
MHFKYSRMDIERSRKKPIAFRCLGTFLQDVFDPFLDPYESKRTPLPNTGEPKKTRCVGIFRRNLKMSLTIGMCL